MVPIIKHRFGGIFIPLRLHQSKVLLWEPVLTEGIKAIPKIQAKAEFWKITAVPENLIVRLLLVDPP